MTEKESFADKVRYHATGDDWPHAHQAPHRRRWIDVLMHRWHRWHRYAHVTHDRRTYEKVGCRGVYSEGG